MAVLKFKGKNYIHVKPINTSVLTGCYACVFRDISIGDDPCQTCKIESGHYYKESITEILKRL